MIGFEIEYAYDSYCDFYFVKNMYIEFKLHEQFFLCNVILYITIFPSSSHVKFRCELNSKKVN